MVSALKHLVVARDRPCRLRPAGHRLRCLRACRRSPSNDAGSRLRRIPECRRRRRLTIRYSLSFNDLARNGGRRNVLVRETVLILVHPEIARLHGDAYAKGAVIAEIHVIEQELTRICSAVRSARPSDGRRLGPGPSQSSYRGPGSCSLQVGSCSWTCRPLRARRPWFCNRRICRPSSWRAHAFYRIHRSNRLRRRSFGGAPEAVFLSAAAASFDGDFAIAALVERQSLALLRPAPRCVSNSHKVFFASRNML